MSYEARNDATVILSNTYRRDFEYLSIRNHDAEQKPFIYFFYYDDVVRSLIKSNGCIKSINIILL